MRVFEIDETAKGTDTVAHVLAEATEKGAVSINWKNLMRFF